MIINPTTHTNMTADMAAITGVVSLLSARSPVLGGTVSIFGP